MRQHGLQVAPGQHERERVVGIDGKIADGNERHYNVVVAEELGHIMLHRRIINQLESVEDFLELQRHPDWQLLDKDARSFGAAVLMPRLQFIEETRQQVQALLNVLQVEPQ